MEHDDADTPAHLDLGSGPVSTLARVVLLTMIPLNLLLVTWAWLGRAVLGVGGRLVVIYLFTVVPALLLGFLLTTVLAYTQDGRPRSLTVPQALAQVVTWLAVLVFGLSSVDFGDTEGSEASVLTRLLGSSPGLLDLSHALMLGSAALAVVAWLVLVGTLTWGRRRLGT